MRPQLSILSFISFTLITFLHAGEWNQHRGPFSNNKSDESINGSNWLKSSSSLQWKVQTPLGFSSFTTYNGNAYTLIAEEDEDGLMREICISLDLKTGKRQWSSHLGIMDYKAGGGNSGASDNKGGDGPRSTPSVLDGLVWAYDSDMSGLGLRFRHVPLLLIREGRKTHLESQCIEGTRWDQPALGKRQFSPDRR